MEKGKNTPKVKLISDQNRKIHKLFLCNKSNKKTQNKRNHL